MTIYKLEKGGAVRQHSLITLRAALEAAGVEFNKKNGGGPSVTLRETAQ